MSALQKLLPAGLAMLLLAACGTGAAPVQPDIQENDIREEIREIRITSPWESAPPGEASQTPAPTPISFWEEADVSYTTVSTILPDLQGKVRQKQRLNGDTVGWLRIPGTTIDDVVLQNPPDTSNSHYLGLDFYGNPSRDGAYCTDVRTQFGSGKAAELSRNTTIYGHSWSDDAGGALFSQLKKFRDPSFAKDHPYIFFSTGAQDMAWEVFAVFDTHIDLPYINPNPGSSRFFDTLDLAQQASLYHYNTAVSPGDRIITLSTCVYSVEGHSRLPYPNQYRFVVMARLASPDEPLKEEAVFAVNRSPLSPDSIRDLVADGALREYTYGVALP